MGDAAYLRRADCAPWRADPGTLLAYTVAPLIGGAAAGLCAKAMEANRRASVIMDRTLWQLERDWSIDYTGAAVSTMCGIELRREWPRAPFVSAGRPTLPKQASVFSVPEHSAQQS